MKVRQRYRQSAYGLITLAVVSVALAPSSSLTPSAHAQAQSAAPVGMVDRFYRGRAVVTAAAQAAGGAQALRGITAISVTLSGDIFNDTQGFSASRIGNPERDGSFRVVNHFDFAGNRFSQRTQQDLAGGFGLDFSTLFAGGTTYNLRNNGRNYTQATNSLPPTGGGGFVPVAARWIPALLLQRALQNFRSISWEGEGVVGGAPADIVEFSWDATTRYRLYITKADHLVRRSETLAPDPITADEISISEFVGEQTVSGVWFPARVQSYRRGARNFDLAVQDVAINPTLADTEFAAPAGYELVADDQQQTTQISPRIYEVSGLGGGLYRSQFVVMDDFVVVFEAPLGIPAVNQIITEIRRVAGDKPIRYVVLSHFHSDHAGGVGAYVDLGATIVAPAEAEAVIGRYAASRSQFQGQGGYRSDVSVRFEPVGANGYEIVDASGRRLRIINFSTTPHVEHVLTLYDPETRTLMNGDLFSRLVRWNRTFDVFAVWLRRNETPVDTILGTHHEPISRADLLALQARSRSGRGQ